MAATKTCFSLFDQQTVELLKSFTLIDKSTNGEHSLDEEDITELQERVHSVKTGMSCLVCKVAKFDSLKAQRDHFKLDWHRYNVKQRLMNKPAIAEEDFEETVSGELSSISGSESEDSEDTDSDEDFEMEGTIKHVLPEPNLLDSNFTKQGSTATHKRNHPKLFLSSEDGQVFSLYRATVFSSKNVPESELHLINGIKALPKETLWIIIMTAGGHFAAAVFDGNSVVAHKTFHRYTVRAKRGTTQGVRDNQQGTTKKSAGANLRRYNEAALVQEVNELLESWSEYLKNCHKIFIRIPTYNKPMVFGGKNPPLNRNDQRVRTIPFATRRPTFKEVKRVQEELSRVQFLGSNKDVLDDVINQLSPKKPKSCQVKPSERQDYSKTEDSPQNTSSVDGSICEETKHSKQAESNVKETCTNVSSKKGKKKKSSHMADQSGQEKISEVTSSPEKISPEQHLWNRFYCAIVSGNTKVITELLTVKESTNQGKDSKTLLENPHLSENNCNKDTSEQCEDGKNEVTGLEEESDESACSKLDVFKVLNERWGEAGSSLLHVASRTSQTEIIYTLLDRGADPSLRDDSGKTPYDKAKSKEARDQFRRFMADYPDAFDYTKSHIPSPLTQEMQDEKEHKEAEKKKAQRKAKKQRLKEQKANEQQKKEKEMEKKKQEAISEREKRALAAEKRFSKQLGNKSGLSCAMCSKDLMGSIPFERLTYKYCTTECVRRHRLILENKGR